MSLDWKLRIGLVIHRHRRNPLVRRFARLCKNIYRASEHPTYDIQVNGERDFLLRTVAKKNPVLFDVGCNVGEWTDMALALFPAATVHSFELSPEVIAQLEMKFKNSPQVILHRYGLGTESKEVDFFCYHGQASQTSSLRAALHSHLPHTVERSRIRRGDEVCRELGLDRIDFLKVDVEGADYEVLAGFGEMLRGKKIAVIQFEHQGGRYLKDFFDFLTPLGYTVGKQCANHIEFRPHDYAMEEFLGPNYVALLSDQPETMRQLSAGW